MPFQGFSATPSFGSLGPVMASRRRRFNLFDFVVLIASTAIGLALWRDGIVEFIRMPDGARSARFYWNSSVKISYVLIMWSLALLGLSLRQPAQPLRRLAFRPAFVVGTAVLIDVLTKLMGYIVAAGINGGIDVHPMIGAKMFLLILAPIEVGLAVAVALAIRVLAFGPRLMRNWLDVAGLAVAVLWIVLGGVSYLFRLTAR